MHLYEIFGWTQDIGLYKQYSQVRIQSISTLSKDSLKEPAQLVEADEPTDQPKTPPRDKDICFAVRIHMNPFCGCQWDTHVECSTNKLAT